VVKFAWRPEWERGGGRKHMSESIRRSRRGRRVAYTSRFVGLLGGVALLLSGSLASATITTNSGQPYVNECAAAGVPTPPPWNYEDAWHGRPTSQWIKAGQLNTNLAGSPGQTTEVFYFSNALGTCVALPRSTFPAGQTPEMGPPTVINLLGVICQGITTGKACFWDNSGVSPLTTLQFGDGPATTHFIGGADLAQRADVCSDCHRGENVFLIHPATPLGQVINRMPTTWHDPIVPAGWPENPGPFPFAAGRTDSCLQCHNGPAAGRFPQVSNQTLSYCGIMEQTFGLTMPVGDLGSPPSAHEPFLDLRDACAGAPPPAENPPQMMMSFDGPAESFWSAQTGTLTEVTNLFTEGLGSMAVNASGYVRLDGLSFSTWALPAVGTRLDLDVYVPPAGQPQPSWLGAVQLFVTIPSAQMLNTYIGQVELTPGGTGWRTGSFQLPTQVRAALLAQHPDVRFGIAVNRAQGAPPILLDNLRFNGALSLPAPAPTFPVQYDFERGGDWTGREAIVSALSRSRDKAFVGFKSLQMDLNGTTASAGRAFTTPTTSPAAGQTVTFRVFIPSGAPVSAVQPYLADRNWVWAQTYNTNLPRNAWVTLTAVVPANAALPLKEIGVKLYTSAAYTGPVYLDAIQW
jgi:hypothetical protein